MNNRIAGFGIDRGFNCYILNSDCKPVFFCSLLLSFDGFFSEMPLLHLTIDLVEQIKVQKI